MNRFPTLADIKKSPCAPRNKEILNTPKSGELKNKKVSKEKVWIQFKLEEFAKEKGLKLKTEILFHESRAWRFDWCFKEIKTAFEYEGIFSKKSRHTTKAGYSGDTEKYNAAQELGWKVYRYTALNYLDLVIDLENI